jgi:oligopeptide/dipeptide ABC transporter ATP-binding protein
MPTRTTSRLSEQPLLRVEGLRTNIHTRRGTVHAVDNISFTVKRGEVLGLVGESGSGKTLTCLSILRLLPKGGQIAGGRIQLYGENLLDKSEREMRKIRGRHISMILQDPLASLNPILSIGDQVMEPIRLHRRSHRSQTRARAIDMLRMLKIPSPEQRMRDYPFQLSGGMRQRVLGAIALSCDPDLLIADEPTTSLDVTVQAQYLDHLRELQRERSLSIIFVTHDLGIVARMCDRVCVMYAGRIVETASVIDLFDHPAHPYTRALLRSVATRAIGRGRLNAIHGGPPPMYERLSGCPFAPRCVDAESRCREHEPHTVTVGADHSASCWKVK